VSLKFEDPLGETRGDLVRVTLHKEDYDRLVNVSDDPHASYSFREYTGFVKSMKVFPEKFAIIYPTLGMMGEAGEVSEKVKKWMRGDRELDKAELVKEVGDVLWYVTALADDLGYTLEDVALMNIEKLASRRDRGVVKGEGDNR
jgi:NTP pyrophosphatase (non-canonical NTP hydrolase)